MAVKKEFKLFHTEEFNFEKIKTEGEDGKETIILSGNAQPLKEDSRNGVRYREKSVKKAAKSLANVSFLFNHNSDMPIGHTIESGLTDSHVTYKVDMDPEEKDFIRKIERGDIKHVSVGCMVENVEWNEEENIFICDIKEYAELSLVPVPGFSNTSVKKESAIYLAEELGNTEALEKLKAEAEKEKDDDEDDKDKDKEKDDDDEDEEEGKEKDDDEDDEDEDDDDDDDKDKDDEEEKLKKEKEAEDELELAEKKKKEDAGAGTGDEKSTEELVAENAVKISELFSKMEEMINEMAVIQSNMDALNDQEENSGKENLKELNPNKDEKFEDKKGNIERTKEELDAKEKALTGENSKKINEDKKVVDLDKLRLKNQAR